MNEPIIKNMPVRKAAGYSFETKFTKFVYRSASAFWLNCKFNQITQEEYSAFATGSEGEVGMLYRAKGEETMSYFYGSLVENFDNVCSKASKTEIAEGQYAVFSTEKYDMHIQGSSELIRRITELWKDITKKWLVENGSYELDEERYPYEFYGEGSADNHNISMDIYIPIKPIK